MCFRNKAYHSTLPSNRTIDPDGQHELHKNEEEAFKVLSLGPVDFMGIPFPLNDLH